MSGNKVFIIAGEASGDLHASNLIKEILKVRPELDIYCVGGQRMAEAGAKVVVSSNTISVVGISEVFSHAVPIVSAFLKVRRWLRIERPDLLILVDFPEFNLMMARYAKSLGIPVLYYISPQIWAWRQGRVKKIAKVVDKMAVILPFEEEFYKSHGVDATFVGHPLLDSISLDEIDDIGLRNELGLSEKERLICLLPGSRRGEIERHLPIMLDTAAIISQKEPESRFCLALDSVSSSSNQDLIESLLGKCTFDISLIEGKTYQAIKTSQLCIAASGTVTLEVAIIGTPLVVIYKVSSLSYHLGKRLIKVPWVSLVNLIAQKEVVPELLQEDARPDLIASKALELLKDGNASKQMIEEFRSIKRRLGSSGASKRMARLVLQFLDGEG